MTKKDTAVAVQGRLKAAGYPDCFVATESLDAKPLTLKGSSLDYLNKAKTAIEALASGLRIEGDVWDDFRAGTLNRTEAATTVGALVTTMQSAKDGLASLIAPTDLAALGQALDAQLASAKVNLQSVKDFLSNQSDADRLKAETSFIELIDAYTRLGASLRGG